MVEAVGGQHETCESDATQVKERRRCQQSQTLAFLSPPPLSFNPAFPLLSLCDVQPWVSSLAAVILAVRALVNLGSGRQTDFSLPTTCSAVHSRKSQAYEPLLLENEREAVADLLQFLESACISLLHCVRTPLLTAGIYVILETHQTDRLPISSPAAHSRRLRLFHFRTMLIYSAAQLSRSLRSRRRRSALLAVTRSTPSSSCLAATIPRCSELLALLLAISRSTVCLLLPQPDLMKLNNPDVAAENKLLIVKLGGLEPLIRQMLSPNVEVQCNAVGCVTNLATHGAFRARFGSSIC